MEDQLAAMSQQMAALQEQLRQQDAAMQQQRAVFEEAARRQDEEIRAAKAEAEEAKRLLLASRTTPGPMTASIASPRVSPEVRPVPVDPGELLAAIQAQTKMVEALVSKSVQAPRNMTDPKGLGKPQSFSGSEADFRAWSRKTENYMCSIMPEARSLLEAARES